METILLNNKPNLSANSLRTYMSNIKSITSKITQQSLMPIEWYNDNENTKTILDYILKNISNINTRKTILTAFYILTMNVIYKDSFLIDCSKVKENDMKNEMNEKQKMNWVEYSDIVKLHETIKNKNNNSNTYSNDFLILSLVGGIYIPPRRLLDWTELKHKNFNVNTDNYIDFNNSSLVFNIYKTFKKYGKQIIPIPNELLQLLKDISNHTKGDYIITNVNGDKMSPTVLNMKINSLFNDKKVGCNGIRHSYISDKILPHLPKLCELHLVAYQMGHSISTQMMYRKDKQ